MLLLLLPIVSLALDINLKDAWSFTTPTVLDLGTTSIAANYSVLTNSALNLKYLYIRTSVTIPEPQVPTDVLMYG